MFDIQRPVLKYLLIDLSLVVKELRVSEAFFGSFCAQDIKLGLAQAERLRVFPFEKKYVVWHLIKESSERFR